MLERVAEAFTARGAELTAPTPRQAALRRPRCDCRDSDLMRTASSQTFDDEHGGFGDAPKFPLTAPIELALERLSRRPATRRWRRSSKRRSTRWAGAGSTTRSTAVSSAARGRATGSEPHTEKLLDVNASLLRTVRRGVGDVCDVARYGERAADIVRYVQTWLADPVDGGWSGSQRPTATTTPATFDARRHDGAAGRRACCMQRWNARMVSAALRAAELLDDDGAWRICVEVARAVCVACYRPGRRRRALPRRPAVGPRPARRSGRDGRRILDAHEATGNIVYEMMAAGARALRRPGDVGRAGRRLLRSRRGPSQPKPSA